MIVHKYALNVPVSRAKAWTMRRHRFASPLDDYKYLMHILRIFVLHHVSLFLTPTHCSLSTSSPHHRVLKVINPCGQSRECSRFHTGNTNLSILLITLRCLYFGHARRKSLTNEDLLPPLLCLASIPWGIFPSPH